MTTLTRTLPLAVAALLLAGCPYLGEAQYQDQIRDFDGDGVEGTRFDGEDCRDDDPTIQRCDRDGDGVDGIEAGGEDCDDDDATVFPGADEICDGVDNDCDGLVDDLDDVVVGAPSWYADDDGDGYGSPDEVVVACTAPPNYIADDRDCDDARDDVHPGAVEFCDAVDRDCDGDPTENAVDPFPWYTDADGDGYGVGDPVTLACEAPPGLAATNDDCDDTEALAHPGAVEIWYDGVDSDCDGGSDFDQDGDGYDRMPEGTDCDDLDPARNPGEVERCNGGVDDDCNGVADNDDPGVDPAEQWTYYVDGDGDAFGDPLNAARFCPNTAPAGYVLIGGDCDDTLDSVLPGGTEVCDNRDNDCDGVVDDNAVGMVQYYVDGDGDGYGGSTLQWACELGPGLSQVGGDCNDADAQTYPGAPEICDDLFRQDCTTLSIYDCDGDGYDDVNDGGTDCDDSRADVSPGANEVCDGADNDCDGLVDSDDPSVDLATAADWYTDADGDGFGGPFLQLPSACAPVPGAAANSDDCDDSRPDVYPGAPELCDTADNDCDGSVDEGPIPNPPQYYFDNDGDGFGNPSLVSAVGCDPPGPDWVDDATDCHDGFAEVNPMAEEVCDGLDNDCDGLLDDLDPSATLTLWYLDDDGDGYGQSGVAVAQCGQPAGYAPLDGDCNDFDDQTNPGASEVCDGGIDNDCDGLGDDADPDLIAAVTWYPDLDNDGFGDPGTSQVQCSQPAGWVADGSDCDDLQAAISPAAIELCDGVDNDCDGLVDDADPGVVGAPFWFADQDGDGWGDENDAVRACSQPSGRLPQAGDCDDQVAGVHPGAEEVCDGFDNDCDGAIDDADPSAVLDLWYADADNDGYGDPTIFDEACGWPGAGWVANADDCDDSDANVRPGAPELCNFLDDDCDGQVDDDDPDRANPPRWYADADFDGYGDPLVFVDACQAGPGYVANATDCDDSQALANPGIPIEFCNGFDDNCDGLVDDQDPMVVDANEYWPDLDGDGWGDDLAGSIRACSMPPNTVPMPGDCLDTDPNVHPGMPEQCGGYVDDNCNGLLEDDDPELVGGIQVWWDGDGDGAGDPLVSEVRCAAGGGWVTNGLDCDPVDPSISPAADEVCDGVDNDCDGFVDGPSALDALLFYRDGDGDGWGDPSTTQYDCVASPGWVSNSGDCNDTRSDVYPGGGPEICDGVDNDCNGLTDEQDGGLVNPITYYPDNDNDGYGANAPTVQGCTPPPGHVVTAGDCDDLDATVFPTAVEGCDGVDNDCDTLIDDADTVVVGQPVWFIDNDGDGQGNPMGPVPACLQPPGYVSNSDDCDDTDPDIHVGGIELCDGVDNDCDSLIDDADPNLAGGTLYYADGDKDGWGDAASPIMRCAPMPGVALQAGDCDDTDATLYPGQVLTIAPVGTAFTTIQGAIDAVCEDAVIRVSAGTWPEGIDLRGKRMTIQASDPLNPPILDAPFAPAILVANGEPAGTTIENLVVRTQGLAPGSGGGALVDGGASVTFRGVSFEQNLVQGQGGGAWVGNGTATFENCVFDGNGAETGGGLSVQSGTAVVIGSVFDGNVTTLAQGGGIECYDSDLTVVDSDFVGNTSQSLGAAIDCQGFLGNGQVALADVRSTDDTAVTGGPSVWLQDLQSATVQDVVIQGGGGLRIGMNFAPGNLMIQRTQVVESNESGVLLDGFQLNAQIDNLLVAGSAWDGLALVGGQHAITNLTLVGNGFAGLNLSSGSGSVRNGIYVYNGFQNVSQLFWTGLLDWSFVETAGEAAALGGTAYSGNPGFRTYFSTLSPRQWDLHHSVPGPAWNAGDPSILDSDGSTSDLGYYGGPLMDASYYDDTDGDGMDDGWELGWFGDLSRDGPEDDDNDGRLTLGEFAVGTDPTLDDTDGDGVLDGADNNPLDVTLP